MFNSIKRFIDIKDIRDFLCLICLAFCVSYLTSNFISQIFYIITLIYFYRSKRPYLWIAFIFVLLSEPGGIFRNGYDGINYLYFIPIYKLGVGAAVSYYDLFYITALFRSIIKEKRKKIFFTTPLLILATYFIITLLISFIKGTNPDLLIYAMRLGLMFTLIISLPRLLTSEKDIFKIYILLIPFIIIQMISQFMFIGTGITLMKLITGEIILADDSILESTKSYSRLLRGFIGRTDILNLFLVTISSILIAKYRNMKNKLFYFVIIICLTSVFISASRGWMIMYTLYILLYFYYINKKPAYLVLIGFSLFNIIMLLTFLTPALRDSVITTINRAISILQMLQGNFRAESSMEHRLFSRLPILINGIKANPIFGSGFSTDFEKYNDTHIGIINLIQQVGIIGFFIFIGFGLNLFSKIASLSKIISRNNEYKVVLLIFNIVLFSLFILSSTSGQYFGYAIYYRIIFFNILLLIVINIFIRSAILSEVNIRKKNSTTYVDDVLG